MFPIILLIIVPSIALVAALLSGPRASRPISIASTLIGFLITAYITYNAFTSSSINIIEKFSYIPSLGIGLSFRINFIAIVLLIMSSIVLLATSVAGNPERDRTRLSSSLILLFQIAAAGLFTSANLFMFFIFWDIGVIAMFFMINILGSANRKIASMEFLIFEIFASMMLLLGIIVLYFYTPGHSLNITTITQTAAALPASIQEIIFVLLFLAFMVNMPLFPTHFWLPDAHSEASTQGSMLLSGVLTKFGGFGMLLLFEMLPIAQSAYIYVAGLAVISIFYSIFVLMRQNDMKRIVAYSTIVEMGIVMLGISALNTFGTNGALYLMLSHGVTIALLFLVVGSMHYIFGDRDIRSLRGVVSGAASSAYAFVAGILAMTGVPLTSGFIADLLLFIGAEQRFGYYGVLPLAAVMLLGAYMYFAVNKSVLSNREKSNVVHVLPRSEKLGYDILLIAAFVFGIFPFIIFRI